MRNLMVLALVLAAGAANAQQRLSTLNGTCEANRRVVQANGAVVLGTGGQTYDRFVRDRGFCQFDEVAFPAWVPSRDTQACFIGYRCQSGSTDD